VLESVEEDQEEVPAEDPAEVHVEDQEHLEAETGLWMPIFSTRPR